MATDLAQLEQIFALIKQSKLLSAKAINNLDQILGAVKEGKPILQALPLADMLAQPKTEDDIIDLVQCPHCRCVFKTNVHE